MFPKIIFIPVYTLVSDVSDVELHKTSNYQKWLFCYVMDQDNYGHHFLFVNNNHEILRTI